MAASARAGVPAAAQRADLRLARRARATWCCRTGPRTRRRRATPSLARRRPAADFRTTRPARKRAPQLYDDLIDEHAAANGVSPDLVRAVIQAESAFNPRARSLKGRDGADAADAGDGGRVRRAERLRSGREHPRRRGVPEAPARPLRRPGRARAGRLQRRPRRGEEVRRDGAALPRNPELRRPDPGHAAGTRPAIAGASRTTGVRTRCIARSRWSTAARSSRYTGTPRDRLASASKRPSAARVACVLVPLSTLARCRRRSRLSGVDRGTREGVRQPGEPPHLRPPPRVGFGVRSSYNSRASALATCAVGQAANDDRLLRPSGREITISSPGRISRCGFGGLAVDVDPADLAGFLGLGRSGTGTATSSQTSRRRRLHAIIAVLDEAVPAVLCATVSTGRVARAQTPRIDQQWPVTIPRSKRTVRTSNAASTTARSARGCAARCATSARPSTPSDPAEVKDALRDTISLVDKMAGKGLIHRNTAGRYKSRLAEPRREATSARGTAPRPAARAGPAGRLPSSSGRDPSGTAPRPRPAPAADPTSASFSRTNHASCPRIMNGTAAGLERQRQLPQRLGGVAALDRVGHRPVVLRRSPR